MLHNRALLILALMSGLIACGGTSGSDEAEVKASVQNRGADTDNWWDSLPRPEWALFEKIEQDQDWFEVYRIADGVLAIYEPGQFEEVISFLIIGDERALLFDTGLGIGNMRKVVDQLTDLDVVVLNSHTHYDHIGGNHQFEFIYGRDTDYTKGRMLGSGTSEVAEFIGEGWVWKELPEEFVAAEFRSQPFMISEIVDEGDSIDIGGRRLEILVTPGHAPDSICLIDRANRLLFTGDTFYLAPLYTHIPGSSFEDYARSAARLAGLSGDIDAAITSHNVPVVDPSYMTALGQAFADIQSGNAENVKVSNGNRQYMFDGFSVIVKGEKDE